MTTRDFDVIHNVKCGQHFYQFYKSTEDYLKVMVQFFKSGLEKGEACLWLVSDKIGVEQAEHLSEQMIPRFPFYASSNQFVIRSAQEWYLTDKHFDEAKALENAETYVTDVLKKGYHRLRGSGDASAIPRGDWPKLEAYEHKAHQMITSGPIIAVCAYPILECSLKETKMVLECHDDVLVGHI